MTPDNGNRYSIEEIEGCLPPAPPPKKRPLPWRPSDLPLDQKRVIDALSHIPRRQPGMNTYCDYRNMAWALVAALKECGQSDPEGAAISLLEAHSPQ